MWAALGYRHCISLCRWGHVLGQESEPGQAVRLHLMRCAGFRCRRFAVADDQLCAYHRVRLEAGDGLPNVGEPLLDEPDGFGYYGVLDCDETGMLCHECGQRFACLGNHAFRSHGLSALQYRNKHGLLLEEPLRMPPLSDGTPRRRPRRCSCGAIYTTPGKRCRKCRAAAGITGEKDTGYVLS